MSQSVAPKEMTENKDINNKLNVLRAGVLGANDGIVSTAGLVIGVAGAANDTMTILVAGIAGLVAGALSMAGGEYSSVSTQRDTEKAAVKKEAYEIKTDYKGELQELADIYQQKGLSPHLAEEVAKELMAKNALAAHAEAELNITLGDYANPWSAALSSVFSFSCGAILPLLAITLLPASVRVLVTFLIVSLALAMTGYVSAYLGGAPKTKAVMRNVVVGMLTMVVTYFIGYFIPV